MLRLFNTFGRELKPFRPAGNRPVTIFTCGPSVYQRAHIGNFRTFLFEDILVRYLEYSGFTVERGMAVTDIEDKSIKEAEKLRISVKQLTDGNIARFIKELKLLNMKVPQYMPRASECLKESVQIIRRLLDKKIAYSHRGNIYFNPLKVRNFGRLFGLDMSNWPKKRRRFHKDTYPGIQWNYGDFILWNGCELSETACWSTELGDGRPSWNVQDPSMVLRHFSGTLSVFCGGIDNLYRHHDYSIAILEAIRPYPMARFWLHGAHLFVDGQKMSKSKGNILYTDMLIKKGYSSQEVRFFLMYGHYRRRLNYSDKAMGEAAKRLRDFRAQVKRLQKKAGPSRQAESQISVNLRAAFVSAMDDDMSVRPAFDAMQKELNRIDASSLSPSEAAGVIGTLKRIDSVLQVIFR